MTYNRVYNYVQGEVWKAINKIVKSRSLTLLYRGDFSDMEFDNAKERLEKSWSQVNFETIEGNDERAIIINLIQ